MRHPMATDAPLLRPGTQVAHRTTQGGPGLQNVLQGPLGHTSSGPDPKPVLGKHPVH